MMTINQLKTSPSVELHLKLWKGAKGAHVAPQLQEHHGPQLNKTQEIALASLWNEARFLELRLINLQQNNSGKIIATLVMPNLQKIHLNWFCILLPYSATTMRKNHIHYNKLSNITHKLPVSYTHLTLPTNREV